MKHFKTFLISTFCLLSLSATLLADPVAPPAANLDLTGDWRALLENSLTRKQITLRIEQKDGRLRGKMASKEIEIQDIDGRFEPTGEILIWSTFYDRAGYSTETNFKGKMEGNTIVGTCRYFDKAYNFRAERFVKKPKKTG